MKPYFTGICFAMSKVSVTKHYQIANPEQDGPYLVQQFMPVNDSFSQTNYYFIHF